ncbi:chromosome transmission fidelity protein 8 homolog [Drosophila suzukii]|uniref:Chromosome transmission fidelity protein 8 homolog n=1 Tax=Drosophila suzukii TaxID=28584 RepID=A0AB39ZFM6_DROSZ|nr:chromosome transmission fidelity protein 8 homolog [Drosophila suzukii]XP_037719398.1 chromosome transmission fidelity protein 8 homolog [Drosophila subpulchrella]
MPILVKTQSAGKGDWAIIELQGDLEVRSNQDMHDQFIGDLYYNKYGQPILIIGHHILQGREQKLDKPFAVLEKSKTNEGERLLDMSMASQDVSMMNATTGAERTVLDHTIAQEHKSRQRTEYTVRAVCTKKLIFKSRPKPIIANVAKSV